MTTITDIAEKLQVSTATVSRALNNSRLVAPELGKKICRTADKMGYVKRNIRRHRGRAILNIRLVLPRHEEPERTLFYDLAALIDGIRSGFQLCEINLLCETNSPGFAPFPHKKGGDINGFVFAFHLPSPAIIAELEEQETPYVILNRDVDGLPCVASENARGMDELVEHLHSRRSELKPAYLSLEGLGQIDERRLAGLTEACRKRKIRFDPEKDVRYFAGIRAIDADTVSEISKNHNALVCVNDIIGTVVLSELDRLGFAVPSEIAVTGFDDSPVRQLSRPLLTTISMPVGALARSAATRLETEIIENIPPKSTLKVPGTLIVGESS